MSRIGIDARMFRPGATGIGRYIKELTDFLFVIDQKNDYVVFLNPEGYESFSCPSSRITKRVTNARYYSLNEQTIFLLDLYKENLDLVHFTHFNAPIFYKRPSIVTIHDLTLSKFPGQKMNTLIHRLAYQLVISSISRNAQKIIAVSKHTATDLQTILQVPKNKIEVIYEGISRLDINNINAKSLLKSLKITRPFFLYVGVWRNHKNLVNLLKAFKIFQEKYQLDYQLVLTGREDNKHYPEVRDTINSLGLVEFVVTPGFVNEADLYSLYQECKALVNPSFYEGFGFPPLEAMSFGKIAIVSSASCHPEIYEDAAIYFDPNSTEDIAEKLYIGTHDEKVIQEKLKLSELQVKKYDWENTAKQTFALYENVLKYNSNV